MLNKKERPEDGWPWQESPNRPYFFYDPEGDGFMYYATEEERDKAADNAIHEYLDDGWSEDVTNIVAGKLTHITRQCNVVSRPSDDDLDEDGCDEDGFYWSDFPCTCDYELQPLNDNQA